MIGLSIVIPTFNEEPVLGRTLAALQSCGSTTIPCEIIVVDGGSRDTTVALARAAGVTVVESERGRGRQMNTGVAAANGRNLLFLHADTLLPPGFPHLIDRALARPGIAAGAFSLAIDSGEKSLAAIAFFANLRSRFLHLPYGDQALFTTRRMFAAVGGFPEIAIMEDFVFIRKLGGMGKITILPEKVTTSARRWRNMGILRTTLINQVIVAGYAAGVPPGTLSRWYRRLRGVGKPPTGN